MDEQRDPHEIGMGMHEARLEYDWARIIGNLPHGPLWETWVERQRNVWAAPNEAAEPLEVLPGPLEGGFHHSPTGESATLQTVTVIGSADDKQTFYWRGQRLVPADA